MNLKINRWRLFALVAIIVALNSATFYLVGPSSEGEIEKLELVSNVFTIDRRYKSMEGPAEVIPAIFNYNSDEIVWVKGIQLKLSMKITKNSFPKSSCAISIWTWILAAGRIFSKTTLR